MFGITGQEMAEQWKNVADVDVHSVGIVAVEDCGLMKEQKTDCQPLGTSFEGTPEEEWLVPVLV